MSRHGGHAAAAGFTLPANLLKDLRERLIGITRRAQPAGGWARVLRADADVNLHKLSWETLEGLARLEPHGMQNPRPLFVARGTVVQSVRRMGKAAGAEAGPHLRIFLRDMRWATWEAVGWRMGERMNECGVGAKIDVAFQLDVNEWNGERRLQLVLQDFRGADTTPVI